MNQCSGGTTKNSHHRSHSQHYQTTHFPSTSTSSSARQAFGQNRTNNNDLNIMECPSDDNFGGCRFSSIVSVDSFEADSTSTSITPSIAIDNHSASTNFTSPINQRKRPQPQSPNFSNTSNTGAANNNNLSSQPNNNINNGNNIHETPFNQYAPVCLYFFHQDTFPRNICLRMISNPYPFQNKNLNH